MSRQVPRLNESDQGVNKTFHRLIYDIDPIVNLAWMETGILNMVDETELLVFWLRDFI